MNILLLASFVGVLLVNVWIQSINKSNHYQRWVDVVMMDVVYPRDMFNVVKCSIVLVVMRLAIAVMNAKRMIGKNTNSAVRNIEG